MEGCDGGGGGGDDCSTKQCLNIHRGNFKIHHQLLPAPASPSLYSFNAHCTHAYPQYYIGGKRRLNSFALGLLVVFIYYSVVPESLSEINDVSKIFLWGRLRNPNNNNGWKKKKKIVPDMNFRQATWERKRESPCDIHTQTHSFAFRCLIRIRAWKLIFYLNSR